MYWRNVEEKGAGGKVKQERGGLKWRPIRKKATNVFVQLKEDHEVA